MLKRVFVVPVFAAVILGFLLAFVWLGEANAGVLMPFIKGGSQSAPTAPPPWSDPATHIELFAPVADVAYHSPIDIIGLSQTFEGTVNVRLLDRDGGVLAERATIGGSVDGFDFFHTYLRFTVTEVQTGTVEIFEESAEDGSRLTEILVPVILLPGQRVLDLHAPAVGSAVCNNITMSGYSSTFEATVGVDIRQRSGELITETFTMGGNLGIYTDFSIGLSVPITQPTALLVSAHETSAESGGLIDLARVPITLYPTDSEECP